MRERRSDGLGAEGDATMGESDTSHAGVNGDGSVFERAKPIALALVIAVLAVAGLRILAELRDVFVLLFLAVLFASALARPAAVLERRGVPRGIAVAIVQAAGTGAVVAVVWLVVPPLVSQLALFGDRLPSYVTRFQRISNEYAAVKRQYPGAQTFESQMESLGARLAGDVGGQLVNLPLTAAKLLFDLGMVYILATLLVMRRERLLENVLLLTSPSRREQTRTVLETIWTRLGGYLRAKLIIMFVVAVLMYISLRLLGVPFAVPLSVIVALGELVPKIGVWVARVPLLIIAAFQGWATFGLTFLASYIIEDVKAYVLGPRVEGHALNMDPLLTILAVLSGTVLLGAAGALIAVPFAAMLQVIFDEVVVPMRRAQIETRSSS
jgi:predicted PurR-regulated permease PerM